ncbi:hypothetical protein R7P34_24850 [Vibrio sp. 780]|uniref:hypothetical protein n=1 Tax=unclassified Vibrio TaxID=2614977 RepID=UPI0029641B72|nr:MULTISPECIES: hypothetical protein [unclassified Vibrio]MDW1950575.1 hypothetical protein [Vibrio sp. 812(2023)]MDW1993636.1 hypothetical protein [Vibrio sp. 780]
MSSANGKILVKNSQPNIIYDGPSPVLALMCNIEHSNPTEIKYVKSIGSEPKGLVLFPLACAMVEAAEIIELVPMCNNGKCEEIKILKKCGNEWRPYNQDEIWYTYVKNYLNLGRPDIFYNVPYWLKITKKTEKKLQTVLDVREPYSISICNANNIDIVFEGEDGTLVKYRGGTRCFKIESKFIQIDTSTAKIGSKVEMKLNYKI